MTKQHRVAFVNQVNALAVIVRIIGMVIEVLVDNPSLASAGQSQERGSELKSDAFQDLLPGLTCFGCGPGNVQGLQIKSYWTSQSRAICRFEPEPHHHGPPNIVNGGIIATVIDCHSVCTAMADAYQRAGRAIGDGPFLSYVTGTLQIVYKAPTPMNTPFEVIAEVGEVTDKKTTIRCEVMSEGNVTATAQVIAIRYARE